MTRSSIGIDNRWYALSVFFVIYLFNYLDRTILSVLQVPIKQELGLTDGQLGAVNGLVFAVFYTTASVPIGRLADRAVRRTVLAVSLFVWSAMTAAMGMIEGFVLLVILRIGVAIGEAGSVPSIHSMISDYFPPDRRATALSLLGLAVPIGMVGAFAGGGWLATTIGWRDAFLYIGLLGIAIVPLLLTVAEPARGRYDHGTTDLPSMRQALLYLWRLRSFRYLAIAGGLNAYVQYAMLSWNAPFYARVFNLGLGEIAGWLALMQGLGGGLGIYLGGFLADFTGRRDLRGNLLVPGAGIAIVVPFGALQYLTSSLPVSLACGFVTSACVIFFFSPIVSAAHKLVLPRMRALTSAMLVLIVNLIGVGLGPLVTGVLSDYLANNFGLGAASLRYAIASALLLGIVSALCWWRAASHFTGEAERPHDRVERETTAALPLQPIG